MSSNFEKLKAKLLELFMLDQPDLDFGIFRIMNSKRQEITQFLDNDLLPQVKQAFAQYQQSDKSHLQAELDKAVEQAKELGVNPDDSKKVQELRAKLAESVDITALENEVYSDLFNFFRRYYKEGDFLSLRRYKEGVYAIPYEGEEVKLYWANNDQYYIKTSEYLRDYKFKLPNGKNVHFKLSEADVEKDNRKVDPSKERRFVLCEEDFISEDNNELIIRFNYLPFEKKVKQKGLNEKAVEMILASDGLDGWITALLVKVPTDKNPDRTLLEKHLTDYTARNTFDYFIHKDLGSFLRRELDFYIKNEIMHLDDIESESIPKVEQYLSKVRVVRMIAHKIILFLEQLENFQKRLWLKKKFVVETNYCITLDRVPEEIRPEIAGNDAQRQEWIDLFAIDEIKAEKLGEVDYSNPLTVEFLKANPYLVLDTQFFSEDFKEKLLASFNNLEEQSDGLLIQSENYQALSLLCEKYKNQIKCVYIDPPYNTDAGPIAYKNGYRSSSWASLLHDRLSVGRKLLSNEGILCVTIDDYEHKHLGMLIEEVFGELCGTISIRVKPSGRPIPSGFAVSHEYALFARRSPDTLIRRLPRDDEQMSRYRETDSKGCFFWEMLRKAGSGSLREDRPTMCFPIYLDENGRLHVPEMTYNKEKDENEILESCKEGEKAIWPLRDDGNMGRWYKGVQTVSKMESELKAEKQKNGLFYVYYRRRPNEGVQPTTFWADAKYSATEHGTALLKKLFSEHEPFSYPKSIHAVVDCLKVSGAIDPKSIILDYFAGSGTTGHAVVNLNREDNGSRKYILVEMGQYFDTVTKPRAQKVAYSTDWNDGKPTSRDTGISHMFKYIRLESYEDCLNNLVLQRTGDQQSLLEASQEFRESYMLGYVLDTEAAGSASLLNIDAFEDPFNYKLNIATGSVGETKPVNIDLVETFNYLLGLRVKHIDTIRGYRVVEGYSPKDEKVLVIWRNTKEKSNEDLEDFVTKQQYNTLDMEFDLIYVNGDNNLENIKKDEDTWKVRLIEKEFQRLMFDVRDV